MPLWALYAQIDFVADRKRAPGDTCPDIEGPQTVDDTLRNKNQNCDWDFAFKVLNLFNAYALELGSYATPFAPYYNNVPIANDLPSSGRAWRVELTHQF